MYYVPCSELWNNNHNTPTIVQDQANGELLSDNDTMDMHYWTVWYGRANCDVYQLLIYWIYPLWILYMFLMIYLY